MKIDLIVFPMHDWKKCEKEGFRTRDAHLIRHFEKNNNIGKILIVDRPFTLLEMILKRRSLRPKRGEVVKKESFLSLTKVSKKIHVLDIFSAQIFQPLILRRDWWDYIFRKEPIIRSINDASLLLKLENRVLFLFNPLSTGVIGKLGEKLVVFDALDNWIRHLEMKDRRGWIARGYEIIKREACVIFANSENTQKLMENPKTKPILVTNGVDKNFFKVKENIIPEDIKNIPKPIIGYAGKIAKRINVELLKFIASELPNFSFVLIGQFLDKGWIKSLFKYKNIFFLGDKHYSELPYYLNNFDICIIPHNLGSLESGEDPIKLYEYLAAGKPVVATNVINNNLFKYGVSVASCKEFFLKQITYWFKKLSNGELSREKIKSNIDPSFYWENKARFIIKKIEETYKEKEGKVYGEKNLHNQKNI